MKPVTKEDLEGTFERTLASEYGEKNKRLFVEIIISEGDVSARLVISSKGNNKVVKPNTLKEALKLYNKL